VVAGSTSEVTSLRQRGCDVIGQSWRSVGTGSAAQRLNNENNTVSTNLRISAATFYGLIRSTAITRKIISSPPRGVSRYWWWWWVTACDMRQAPVWLAELLLNNNSGELVPVADCSDSKWAAQPRWICPYRREFVCDSLWSCCPQLPSLQIVLIRCLDEKSEMIMAYFRQVNLIKRNSDRLKQSQQWSWNLQ